MPDIHSQAIVAPQADLADDVRVGPFCLVDGDVSIGAGTQLCSGVVIQGRVTIGQHNTIREGVTIRGGSQNGQLTLIGNYCSLLAHCHVGHDCRVGDHVELANGVLLNSNAQVHHNARLLGNTVLQAGASVGCFCLVKALAHVVSHVPPFMVCEGNPAHLRGINFAGLQQGNFPSSTIDALSQAHRLIFRENKPMDDARQTLRAGGLLVPQVNQFLSHLEILQEHCHVIERERAIRIAA